MEAGRAGGQTTDRQGDFYTFGETVQLQPISIKIDGNSVAVEVLWRVEKPVEDDLTVFVHLYGPGGELVAQADGYPIAGLAPFWLWPAGQTIEDHRALLLPQDAAEKDYSIGIGLYNPTTGERIPVISQDGVRQANDVVLIPLTRE